MADNEATPIDPHFPYAILDADGLVHTACMMSDALADSERTRLQALGYQDVVKLNEGDVAIPGQPIILAADAAIKAQVTAIHETTREQIAQGVEWPEDSGLFLAPSVGQITLSALAQASVSGVLLDSRFPLPWPRVGGQEFYFFPNAADVAAMYASAVNRAATLLTDLQSQVSAVVDSAVP
jgi:hypothetical protein